MHQRHCTTEAQKVHLASQMIAQQGTRGLVSYLSKEHDISRQSLYTWKSSAQTAIESVFCAKKGEEEDRKRERAVLTLFTEGHASREGIQYCIKELLGENISLGAISAIINKAGRRAQEWLSHLSLKGERVLALDEQYGSKRGEAYLNIVDVWSSLVVTSVPPVAVDGESWTLLLWQIQEQGMKWHTIVSDGGKAIQDAVHEVTPDQVHQRDIWHVIHEYQKVQGRVDREVLKLQEQTPVVERQAKRVAAGQKPRGKNPKTDVGAHCRDVQQMEYIATSLRYLSSEFQRLLGIVVLAEQIILGMEERQEEIKSLLELLSELCEISPKSIKQDIERLFHHVQAALPALLGFCPPLDAIEQQARQLLGEQACRLIGWAWLHRAILGPKREKLVADFPPAWQSTVATLFGAWDQAVRSSSVVENWHSVLRPFIAVHRHLSAQMLALLAVWHNHRVASRGFYKGESPLMRSGLKDQATDWFLTLGYPPTSSAPVPMKMPSIPASEQETDSIAA
jgi:Transposase, Mutator family